jgi:HAD superfamily hydrolase (TIGR01549 family)
MRPLALFDLDDTLCDRAGAFSRWAHGFIATHGLDDDALPWLREVDESGRRLRTQFFALVRERFALEASVADLCEAYQPAYIAEYRCDPAVLDGLTRLRSAGWTVGIVTNGAPSQLEKITHTGLDAVVDGWAISEVEEVRKPDPEIFRRAARTCGAALGVDTWMVGDNPVADIGGAVLTGLRSAWIDLGRAWDEPGFKPDHTCAGPLAAIDLVAAGGPASGASGR